MRPERSRENLLRLRSEGDTDAELTQPLADGVRRKTECPGDREQESEGAEDAERDGRHLRWKERQSKLAGPGAGLPDGNRWGQDRGLFCEWCRPSRRYRAWAYRCGWRTMSVVVLLGCCEIGKNAAAVGSSLSDMYFPSATMPTIWICWPERVLEEAADGLVGVEESPGELLIDNSNSR